MNLSCLQKPGRYINREFNSVNKNAPLKVALAFPDVYEIGMSHLGLKILYSIINKMPFASAERVFSPWIDLETEMKARGMFLASLESNRPLRDFDMVGFSLQYELSYTTVLNMLHLGGIPVRSEERLGSSNRYPLVIAGGPCTVNPAPMTPFIDAFLIGDGEEAIKEILETYYLWRTGGDGRKESILESLSRIEGMYVPAFHNTTISNSTAGKLNGKIRRRFLQSLDSAPYPDKPVVPYTSIVHDRINIEVSRGCSMGCRFCQAGMIYRPVRERTPEKALDLAEKALKNTGYDEVAFTSLSAGDYSCLLQVVREFNRRFSKERIALSLPSLRVASISRDILKEIRTVRKTGFTIAPEAGSDRLRRVINKDFSEEDYDEAIRTLFEEGWHNLKLYFMIGLPTETDADMEAIPKMALKALRIAKQFTKRYVNINIGVSPFVPKAHTPFQWYGQMPSHELKMKKNYLKEVLTRKGFHIKGHDPDMSLLEAAFSRGNEKISHLIEKAWLLGCRLDGWSEVFDFDRWKEAMDLTGLDAGDFAMKSYDEKEILPWDKVDIGISKDFLWKESRKAVSETITTDCRKVCHNCGLGCYKDTEKVKKREEEKQKSEDANYSQSPRSSISPVCISNRFNPVRIRVEFSKTGRLRYLSHLELMTLLHRAIRRAGFPIEYTKGFHPAPKISFGPPLGVGIAGLSEYFDMEVMPPFELNENRTRINNTLPEGVRIKDMSVLPARAESLNSFITRYEYEIRGGSFSEVRNFLSEKEIKIKREKCDINIRNMVEEARLTDGDIVTLIAADQGDMKVRLGELLPVVFSTPIEKLDVTRIAVYGWKGGWAKPVRTSNMQLVNIDYQ